jgi:ATP-dependent DNA helicase RecQ
MSEYARRGLERIREALGLVLAYFAMDKEDFIKRFLGTKPDLLQHATTARSFQRIVTDVANPAQMKVITAPSSRNMLVLAGPGSGKTKTVVHRCAYLLRVERVRPQSVLVCCFNRHAAIELRRRLADLVGPDARGVAVLTYHGLAMRLLGYSLSGRTKSQALTPDFDAIIPKAVELLRGISVPPGLEPDEVRDRLLAGYQYILVDEYQDIDEPQYELISAIAGRTIDDADLKLSILAVGDDDQNIYSFRGANVEFIRRFQRDYGAEIHYLVENYRSTRYIIEASNALIAANKDRMKTDHPIRIDAHRALQPAGGEFGQCDHFTGGKVQVIRVPDDAAQARAVAAELKRLKTLGVGDWSKIAVLSRTHRELAQVRVLAEAEGIPIRWWADREKMPPLQQVREIHRFLRLLSERRNASPRASELIQCAEALASASEQNGAGNPWTQFLHRMLEAWKSESDDAELPMQEAIEFFYESCAESRRDFSYGDGVTLCTVHAAKGAEHDHLLLIGAWPLDRGRAAQEEARRTFYVGMTRARRTLAVFDRTDVRPSLPESLGGTAVFHVEAEAGPDLEPDNKRCDRINHCRPPAAAYGVLGLDDLHLSYACYFETNHLVHAALAKLQPGDGLTMQQDQRGIGLLDANRVCVARLSRKAEMFWKDRLSAVRDLRVLALVHRTAEQEDNQERAARARVGAWEIPVVEVMFQNDLAPPNELD